MEEEIKDRDYNLHLLKENLHVARARMKQQADKYRSKGEFAVGDMVYLRLQPYRQTSIAVHNNLKLSPRFYGP